MPVTVADISKLKEAIRQSFRKACLKRLEGQETEAVKILQEELPPKIRDWKSVDEGAGLSIEALLAEELARTESAHWIVRELEARQAIVSAKLQLEISAIKANLESGARQPLTLTEAQALNGRITQELAEKFKEIEAKVPTAATMEELLRVSSLSAGLKIDEIKALVEKHTGSIAARAQDLSEAASRIRQDFAEEISGYENRETRRWTERQGAWARVLDGVLKKADMESALWQAQNAIGERVEAKLTALDNLPAEVRHSLEEQVQKMVTAEAFEERLMASTGMLGDALTKAFQDTSTGLQAAIEKRISDTIMPTFQRLNSLATFSDFERVSREVNEKLSKAIAGQIEGGLRQLAENLARVFEKMETAHVARSQALMAQLQAIRDLLDKQEKNSLQVTMLENLRAFSDRIALMLKENSSAQSEQLQAIGNKLDQNITESVSKKLKNMKIVTE